MHHIRRRGGGEEGCAPLKPPILFAFTMMSETCIQNVHFSMKNIHYTHFFKHKKTM
jgi:hypothetical protein